MSGYVVELYRTIAGKCPFQEWFDGLHSVEVRNRIRQRLIRAELGNIGDFKPLGDGLYEMRFNMAGGIRIYFGFTGKTVILLLSGGDKGSQSRDIKKAKIYWGDYQHGK